MSGGNRCWKLARNGKTPSFHYPLPASFGLVEVKMEIKRRKTKKAP